MEVTSFSWHHSKQEQGLNPSIAFQAYVLFLAMLGTLIQVMFQGNGVSPIFQKYNGIISTFIVAISIYVGAVIVGKRFWIGIIGVIRLLFGTIAPILLLLILVPLFGWLLLVLWVFLAAKMAWDYLQQLYHHLLYQASGRVANLFVILKTHFNLTSESQELPV